MGTEIAAAQDQVEAVDLKYSKDRIMAQFNFRVVHCVANGKLDKYQQVLDE